MTDPARNPLRKIAVKVGAVWAGLAGLVGVGVNLGVLNAAQADALTAAGEALDDTVLLVGGVVGFVLPVGAALLAAFTTARKGEHEVTPNTDPVDVDGVPLVRPDGEVPLGAR